MRFEHIAERLSRYVERNVFPTMNNLQRIGVRTFLGMVKAKPDAFKEKIIKDSFLGWFITEDEDGEIDIDPMLDGLKEAVEREGTIVLDTKMFGKMTFHPQDIELLIRTMRE